MAKAKAVTAETAIIEVPIAEPDASTYIARETGDIKVRLDRDGAAAFRRFHAGLLRDGAKIADGKPVRSKADAVRWLFANLAAS